MENQEPKKKSPVRLVIAVIVLIFFGWLMFGGGAMKMGESNMQQIKNKVAEDAVAQYEIAKNNGDKMQTYMQAGMAAAAYLQAKDEANYKKWKAIEKQAGQDVGINIP
jgi:hypothetical protein